MYMIEIEKQALIQILDIDMNKKAGIVTSFLKIITSGLIDSTSVLVPGKTLPPI